MSTGLDVLVTGATGQQGGSAARHLAKRGHRVRALTRNVTGPAAQALAATGVQVIAGDLDDGESVSTALDGVDAVFLITTPFERGIETEMRQAFAVVDAARGDSSVDGRRWREDVRVVRAHRLFHRS